MRFLANENVTGTVIQELRQRGHDVLSVKESMRSEEDDVILARAQAEQRIVVTHDKDFGELAFRSQLPAGEPAYYRHSSAKLLGELQPGDRLWMVPSGANIGHEVKQAG